MTPQLSVIISRLLTAAFLFVLISLPPASFQAIADSKETQDEDKRFILRNNGIVLDTATGLEWVVGPDRDLSRMDAVSWIKKLTLDGGGWRLPSRSELRALYQKHKGGRYVLPDWVNLKGSGIWSNHIRIQMRGEQLYVYYAHGIERTTPFQMYFFDMRTLSVRDPREDKR